MKNTIGLLTALVAASAFAQQAARPPDPATVRRNAMIEQAAADVQRLGENFDILAENQSKLEEKVARIEGALGDNGVKELKDEIDALRAENEKLRRDMANLRDQVVADISKKIAAMNLGGGGRAPAETRPSGPKPINNAARTAPPPPAPTEQVNGYEHVVEAGQTLSVIARGYGVTVQSIKSANNLKSDTVRIGQKLFIPDPPKKK